ncbi:hypothetical protein [Aliagarivorans taiwanensis]|uniref:hypothetical protein n=1 Tax=Aliagarivorans taiwanensis TaxID=561966 RepID=UPI0012FB6745|nr:hypothetical protein [Aliagarivorans taiwanensis]
MERNRQISLIELPDSPKEAKAILYLHEYRGLVIEFTNQYITFPVEHWLATFSYTDNQFMLHRDNDTPQLIRGVSPVLGKQIATYAGLPVSSAGYYLSVEEKRSAWMISQARQDVAMWIKSHPRLANRVGMHRGYTVANYYQDGYCLY